MHDRRHGGALGREAGCRSIRLADTDTCTERGPDREADGGSVGHARRPGPRPRPGRIEIFDYGTGTGNDRFVMQQSAAPDGCLLGDAWNPSYPGSMVMICPAWTPTPAAVFGTTTSYEAVTGDDYTRDRMWFFQGLGSPTFFRP